MPAISLLRVNDPNDPLLDDIYSKLILPNFPHDDRDAPQSFRTFLALNDENRAKKTKYHVVAALKGSTLVGTTIFTFNGCDTFCFMNGHYTAVLPEERRQNLAKTLSDHRVQVCQMDAKCFGYQELDFTIITLADARTGCESPNGDSSPSPETLKMIWRGWGHELIDFPYVQLPLADNQNCLVNVLLGIKPHSERYKHRDYLTTPEMKCVIDACNYFRLSTTPLSSYPEHREMFEFLERHPNTRILR
jgi:hypothetical protein